MTSSEAAWPFADRVFAAVLFDLDGTLINSQHATERSWLRWAREHDVPLESFAGLHGRPAAQIVAQLLPPSRRALAFARIEALEVQDTDGIDVLPGALAALTGLPSQLRAIVTSCTAPLATARLAACGLPSPEVLVTADQVDVGKPDPAPYLLAAARLGVDPRECLAVEDAPAGLTAARAAGAATLAVTTTHAAHDLAADVVVATLARVVLESGPRGVRVRPAVGGLA